MTRSVRQVAGAFLRRRKSAGRVQLQKWVVEWVERRYRQTREWPINEDVIKERLGPVVGNKSGDILDLKHNAVPVPMSSEEEQLVDEIICQLDQIGAGEALSKWSHRTKVYWIAGEMNQPVPRELMLSRPAVHNHDAETSVEVQNILCWMEEYQAVRDITARRNS